MCEMQPKQYFERHIPPNAYITTKEIPQMNNLTLHLKELEEEEQTMIKVSRREKK